MGKSIKISPKHGVNPTIPVCFWCGKEKNEVALLGKLKGDAEAPMHMVLNYEPCDACKQTMESGITLISVTSHPADHRPPIQQNLYPTGEWSVITKEAAQQIFPEAVGKDNTVQKILLEDAAYQQLIKASRQSAE